MLNRREFILATAALPMLAHAKTDDADWPQRPVRILVGFPPGQSSDIMARMLAQGLEEKLKQPFIVENSPGAGATLAISKALSAKRDGYTILWSSSGPLTIAPHLYKRQAYDPRKDLEIASLTGWSPLVLVVNANSPFKTLPDLVKGSMGGDLNYGSGGNGVTNHLTMEMFKLETQAKLLHVPYSGAAPAITALISNQIQALFEVTTPVMPHILSGALRPLAVTSLQRYHELPDVPTVAEFYPKFEAVPWSCICAGTGTPPAIIDKLSTSVKEVISDQAFAKRMIEGGMIPFTDLGRASGKAYFEANYKKWQAVVKNANISLG